MLLQCGTAEKRKVSIFHCHNGHNCRCLKRTLVSLRSLSKRFNNHKLQWKQMFRSTDHKYMYFDKRTFPCTAFKHLTDHIEIKLLPRCESNSSQIKSFCMPSALPVCTLHFRPRDDLHASLQVEETAWHALALSSQKVPEGQRPLLTPTPATQDVNTSQPSHDW